MAYTFNTRMENPETKPVEIIVNRSEIIDIQIQMNTPASFIFILLLVRWARAQGKQSHIITTFFSSTTLLQPTKNPYINNRNQTKIDKNKKNHLSNILYSWKP